MGLLSRFIQKQRMAKVAPYLHGDVLDVGCSAAAGLELEGDKITRYVGIDYDESALAGLSEQYPTAEFHHRDLDDDELGDLGTFDCVMLTAVIEHLYNQKFAMLQLKGCVKPDGAIVLTTPTPFGNDVVHRIGARIGLFQQEAADDHHVIYNKHRFTMLARDLGFEIEHYSRFQFGCNQLVVLRPVAA